MTETSNIEAETNHKNVDETDQCSTLLEITDVDISEITDVGDIPEGLKDGETINDTAFLSKIQEIDPTFTLEKLYNHLKEEMVQMEKLKDSQTWKAFQMYQAMLKYNGNIPSIIDNVKPIDNADEVVQEDFELLIEIHTPIVSRLIF